jgi:hypothetical protein
MHGKKNIKNVHFAYVYNINHQMHNIILIHAPCIFYYFLLKPTKAQLFHKSIYITTVFCVTYTATRFDAFMSSTVSYNQCLIKLHTFL